MDIILRALELADVDFLYNCENDSSQWAHNSIMAPVSREALTSYILTYDTDITSSRQLRLLVADGNDHTPLGIADFFDIDFVNATAYVGIYIIPAMRCKGLGRRAMEAMCDYASSFLHLRILAAKICGDNSASIRMFGNSGFATAGILPKWIKRGNEIDDLHIMTRSLD